MTALEAVGLCVVTVTSEQTWLAVHFFLHDSPEFHLMLLPQQPKHS